MALAQNIVATPSAKYTLADNAYNKRSLQDPDDLPRWFLDDERQFNSSVPALSAEAIAAVREKAQALNSRPTKKVREAKMRKRVRRMQRDKKIKSRKIKRQLE